MHCGSQRFPVCIDPAAQILERGLLRVRQLLLVGTQSIVYPRAEKLQFSLLARCARVIGFEQIVTHNGSRAVDIKAQQIEEIVTIKSFRYQNRGGLFEVAQRRRGVDGHKSHKE